MPLQLNTIIEGDFFGLFKHFDDIMRFVFRIGVNVSIHMVFLYGFDFGHTMAHTAFSEIRFDRYDYEKWNIGKFNKSFTIGRRYHCNMGHRDFDHE